MSVEIKQKVWNGISFILFITIIIFVFSRVTYLFREPSVSRDNVTAFEKEGDLDVICVGSSTVAEYYQPFTAWNSYHYTSYSYATLYGLTPMYWTYIERILQSQNPDLFVVDLRMLATETEDGYEQGVRFWTDSLPVFSTERWKALRHYLPSHVFEDGAGEMTDYLFDIAKYHSNTDALALEANWKYINNKGIAEHKGYILSADHKFFEKPIVTTAENGRLSEIQSDVLYHLLDYCKEQKLNVLFVVCPYILQEGDMEVYKAAEEIVRTYGYDFLNTNLYYDEMGLDFETDIKNINHVNCAGAEKYTNFLAGYITENYQIDVQENPDIRAQWDGEAAKFKEILKEEKEALYQTVENKKNASDLAKEMSECSDFALWTEYARNSNFTVITCGNLRGSNLENMTEKERQLLKNWGIDDKDKNNFLYVKNGDNLIYSAGGESIDYTEYFGVADGLEYLHCEIHMNENMDIKIGEEQYAADVYRWKFILIDNNFKKVVDDMEVCMDDNGFTIERTF